MKRRRKKSTARQAASRPFSAGGRAAARLGRERVATIAAVAAVLRHETANLLGALNTCVELLRRNPHVSGEDAKLLDIIQSGSRRLEEIVSEFSAFGRPQAPKLDEVELHALIENTLQRLRRDDRCSPSIVVKRRLDPAVQAVRADREQLGRALWHLMLNAVQAIGDQGVLEIETRRAGRETRILVRDTGPGIEAAILAKIFAPLYGTRTRGAGLGLSIARSIVEAHGGRIAVQSKSGQGASFIIVLPAHRKRADGEVR